jgi:hypothetical protein
VTQRCIAPIQPLGTTCEALAHQWLLAPLGDIEAVIPLSHYGQDMATFPEGKLTQLFEDFF